MRTSRQAGGLVMASRDGMYSVAVVRMSGQPAAHWTLPRGPVPDGVAPARAALRAVRMLTGLTCEVATTLPVMWDSRVERGVRVVRRVEWWRMRPVGGRLGDLDEAMRTHVAECRWLPVSHAAGTLALQSERELVAAWAELEGMDLR